MLFFLDAGAQLVGRYDLPDAASDIVPGPEAAWYVAGRNGILYRFSFRGEEMWHKEIRPSPSQAIMPVATPFLTWESEPYLRIAASILCGGGGGGRLGTTHQ